MNEDSVCRCCLSPGAFKDMNSTYVWLNKKEVYSDMLHECFNIAGEELITPQDLGITEYTNEIFRATTKSKYIGDRLSKSEYNSSTICENCIKTLRISLDFKLQVLKTEEELLKKIKHTDDYDQKLVTVKLEPKADSGDDSDDYFLADTVRDIPEKIKKEKEPKKKIEKKKAKPTKKAVSAKKEWRSNTIKTLVSRLATSINSCELPEITIKKTETATKSRKVTIAKDAIYNTKVNLMWTTKSNHDKTKHKENLQTILKYSNATPFKNKSLLGFICGYCTATYPDPADLRAHTEIDHKVERLEFKSNFDMTEYNVKLDVSDLICTLCDEKMNNLTILKEHLVKIHNKVIYNDIKDHILQFKLKKGEVYDCAMCTSTYETFKMLKQHMNKHYCNYSCNLCDTSFATKRSLNAHRTTHQEGSFKCDHCEKIFPSRTKKHYHEKTKHLGARNISNCPYCNEPFRSYYQRNQHLIKVHNSEAQYKCNICNKTYILKSLLVYHIKKCHLMERNCQCTECGYRFFSKKALKAHMVKHTGEKIYACEVCHKSYARKYTLREHMRIHNNDRRFKCHVCGMSFVQKCSLKSHLLSNHGISVAASDITTS